MKKNKFGYLLFATLGMVVGVIFHNQFITPSIAEEGLAGVHAAQYQKCLLVSSPKPHKMQHFNAGRAPVADRMVTIPQGWAPIGGIARGRGDGYGDHGFIILCK